MELLPLQTIVFKAQRGCDIWTVLIKRIQKQGHKVLDCPEKCDVSIVLSGKFENPSCFYGKRVLLFHSAEWGDFSDFFHKILTRYYDKVIDITDFNFKDALSVIKNAAKQ